MRATLTSEVGYLILGYRQETRFENGKVVDVERKDGSKVETLIAYDASTCSAIELPLAADINGSRVEPNTVAKLVIRLSERGEIKTSKDGRQYAGTGMSAVVSGFVPLTQSKAQAAA